MTRPQPSEHQPYFSRYIDLVPEEDIVPALERQSQETTALLAGITEDRSAFRYAPGKWSVKEVVNHMADCERIFACRALCFARGEAQSLPGFDENTYAANANAERRPFREIADELQAVRRATLALFRSLSPEAWGRIGTANEKPISVRAIAYVTLGHERHHVKVLRERYL